MHSAPRIEIKDPLMSEVQVLALVSGRHFDGGTCRSQVPNATQMVVAKQLGHDLQYRSCILSLRGVGRSTYR